MQHLVNRNGREQASEPATETGNAGAPVPVRGTQPSLLSSDCPFIVALSFLFIPAVHWGHLPLRIDLAGMGGAYWAGTAIESIFFAIVLSLIGLPFSQTLAPFFDRYRTQKIRILLALVLLALMIRILGFGLGVAITADGLALAEFFDRRGQMYGLLKD